MVTTEVQKFRTFCTTSFKVGPLWRNIQEMEFMQVRLWTIESTEVVFREATRCDHFVFSEARAVDMEIILTWSGWKLMYSARRLVQLDKVSQTRRRRKGARSARRAGNRTPSTWWEGLGAGSGDTEIPDYLAYNRRFWRPVGMKKFTSWRYTPSNLTFLDFQYPILMIVHWSLQPVVVFDSILLSRTAFFLCHSGRVVFHHIVYRRHTLLHIWLFLLVLLGHGSHFVFRLVLSKVVDISWDKLPIP